MLSEDPSPSRHHWWALLFLLTTMSLASGKGLNERVSAAS